MEELLRLYMNREYLDSDELEELKKFFEGSLRDVTNRLENYYESLD